MLSPPVSKFYRVGGERGRGRENTVAVSKTVDYKRGQIWEKRDGSAG